MTNKKPFQLEPRYWVFKRKHLLPHEDANLRNLSDMLTACNPKVCPPCIVVPESAPHYFETLAATERQWRDEGHGQAEQDAKIEYVWSYDEDYYLAENICGSVDEALAAANDGAADLGWPVQCCSVGIVRRWEPTEFFGVDDLLSVMQDNAASSECGEFAANSDWLASAVINPVHKQQLEQELHALINNFFARHPEYAIGNKFFTVEHTSDYDLATGGDEEESL